jgi:hypothetical protein
MDTDDLVVDGNAMGGGLGEVFLHEMTSARVGCSGCGAIEPVGGGAGVHAGAWGRHALPPL